MSNSNQNQVYPVPDFPFGAADLKLDTEKLDPKKTQLGARITSGSGVRGFYGTRKTLSGKDALNVAIDGYLYAMEQIVGARKRDSNSKELRFVFGRDPRLTGNAIKGALFLGIHAAQTEWNTACAPTDGISLHLIDIGIGTTPMIQNAVRHFDAIGGAIITASHNPREWNGYKFLTANNEPGNPNTQRGALLSFGRMDDFKERREKFLQDLFQKEKKTSGIVSLMTSKPAKVSFRYQSEGMQEEAIEAYFSFLREMTGLTAEDAFSAFVEKARKIDLPIIVDHNGGSAKGFMADLHRRFGLKVEEIGGDYGVGVHRIEPEGEALRTAKDKLQEQGKGFAVVHDWDADRGTLVLLSDGQASDLGPQYTCALAMYAMINQYVPIVQSSGNKTKTIEVVVNGNTSGSARVLANQISLESGVDIKIVEVETGEVNLVEKMEEIARDQAGIPVIGIEGSCGGVIFGGDQVRATSRDGTLSALMAAKLMISTGQSLGSIVKNLPTFHTCFKSIDEIYAGSLEIKQALESEFKSKIKNHKAEGNFTLAGIEGKDYSSYEIVHYIGTEVFKTMGKDTNGGYKIRLTDRDGNESFLWYRDSKTEPEIYIESDSTDAKESEILFELLKDVVMRVNKNFLAQSKN